MRPATSQDGRRLQSSKGDGKASRQMVFSALNPRNRSLPRATAMVLGSLILAFLLSHFPDDRASLKLLIPTLLALVGTCDTMRCLQHRWSLYHGAVVVLMYMDVLALCMILFLLLYPYGHWLLQS
jgi:hypothetical protein